MSPWVRLTRFLSQSALLLASVSALFVAGLPLGGPVSALAENQKAVQDATSASQPIEITADRLISNAKEKYAEFIGKVKAKQGAFELIADTLRIYYEGDLVNQKNQSSDQGVIKKIVAFGNVDITTESYAAKADQVEYDVATMIIVLSGKNATVTSGQNSVTGSKITLYRADGHINVEGSPDKRVNAVFYSEGKTPDLSGSGAAKKNADN